MEPQTKTNDHSDGRRARELYRFFHPERSLLRQVKKPSFSSETPSPPVSSGDGSLPAPTSPALLPLPSTATNLGAVSSVLPEGLTLGDHNTTLTSFAHLAALQLNVERVLISVSDRSSQFIIAQSTQFFHKPTEFDSMGDGVFDGCFTLNSNAWKMCKETIELPPSDPSAGEFNFVTVNDLGEDERYRNLPFVKEDPYFRFYAGTPLTTETNINIGAFFLLDKKPHDGLTDSEKEIMGSIGVLIMDYLRVSRQAGEGRRAARISRGLSCFVEGSSSFVETPQPSYNGSAAPGTPSSSNIRANHLSVGSCNSGDLPSQRSRRSQSNDARSFSTASDSRADQCGSSIADMPLPDWWAGSRQKGQDESNSHSWAFRRAANLLRESLELEGDGGVMFLEASNNPLLSDIEASSDCSGFGEASNPAPVLAISTTEEPFAPRPGSTVLYPATNLESGFLQQLLRRHAKGKLWSFHRDGLVSSSDDEKPRRMRSRMTRPPMSTDPPCGSNKKWKAMENSMLNLYFPNATQVMFVPLWNAANSQWFGGCFCWNTLETRVFNPSVELSSVLGFGSSVMAECNRVESLISDRQKGDFIGSISHELRSPLHGILAAAEFLSATQLDEFQGSLLETINACGRTLLDTMNQVLDYSKIVSLEKSWRHMRRGRTSPDSKPSEQTSAHLDTYMATDIALLAEEVVEGVCLGHSYGQKSTATYDQSVLLSSAAASQDNLFKGTASQPHSRVEVAVDIAPNDWTYLSQPGALRRIIMNLFGNAMKYTDSGRVSLHLELADQSDSRLRRQGGDDLVNLIVSDTGKGISEEFLRGRLFTPFAQEDTLAVGTGLGLSIVRSLVRSLHGNINIHSQPGEGTTVKVSLPLSRIEEGDTFDTSLDSRTSSPREKGGIIESTVLRDAHAGRRAAILGFSPEAAAEHPLWSTIARYLTEWYGLELVSWPSGTPVDIVLVHESNLSANTCQTLQTFRHSVPALLIVCNQVIDYKGAHCQYMSLANIVKIIHPPCGPQKLAQNIRRCLDSHTGSSTTTPEQISLPSRPDPRTFLTQESEKSEAEIKVAEVSDSATDMTPDSVSSGSSSLGAQSPRQEIEQPFTAIVSPPSPFLRSSGESQLLSQVEPITEHGQPEPEVKASNPAQPRRARVLVVDDNAINLNLMLTFMKKRNLETLHSAENGQLAVEAVERLPEGYDLIFMDMSMPVMDGFEATRAIRSLEKERDGESAIIIALTGLSSSRDESDALSSGVDLFLTKPVSFKEVSRLLEEWEGSGLRDRCL